MKEVVIVFVILASSVVLNRFAVPSSWERDAVQWNRKAREEQERITLEILMVRNSINHQLEIMNDGTSERDLEVLRMRLENENRNLQYFASAANELKRDSWTDAKNRAKKQVTQARLGLQRVQKRVDKTLSSNDRSEKQTK